LIGDLDEYGSRVGKEKENRKKRHLEGRRVGHEKRSSRLHMRPSNERYTTERREHKNQNVEEIMISVKSSPDVSTSGPILKK